MISHCMFLFEHITFQPTITFLHYNSTSHYNSPLHGPVWKHVFLHF
jgi:hypothetical protein